MSEVIEITSFTDLVGGDLESSPIIKSGDRIVVTTPPGCWGAMITPHIQSGHEVSLPVKLEGASVGDSVALRIEKIKVVSKFASSGTGKRFEGRFLQDPTINAICPKCETKNPETIITGIGEEGIVCANCREPIIPQSLSNGYTIAFDEEKTIGVTVSKNAAETIANRVFLGEELLPAGSSQHLVTLLAKSDFFGPVTRVVPMVGNIGCVPKKPIPSSRNAGDMYSTLVTNTDYADILKEDMNDAHMDVNTVCEGSIVISPVMVDGAGIYMGDVHSIQGNGELAKHTVDVIAEITVKVELIKGLSLQGPIVLPVEKDIDYRFRPFSKREIEVADDLVSKLGMETIEKHYPIQAIGSGHDLNDAVENAVERMSNLTNLSNEEVMNRATISGSVDIGRTSGLVYITLMLPESVLSEIKLLDLVRMHYQGV